MLLSDNSCSGVLDDHWRLTVIWRRYFIDWLTFMMMPCYLGAIYFSLSHADAIYSFGNIASSCVIFTLRWDKSPYGFARIGRPCQIGMMYGIVLTSALLHLRLLHYSLRNRSHYQ